MEQRRGRLGRPRRRMANWWRSAKTSSYNSARLRNRPASQEKNAEINASMPATLRRGTINR